MARALHVLEPLCLLLVPAMLLCCALMGWQHTALLSTLVVLLALLPFFLRFERQRPRPRDLMPIVVLAAVAAVGRALFAPLPNFKPVSAIIIVGAVCFGRQSGFLIGALAALASNLFFGQGAWTPWQMYAWGLMGYAAGCLRTTRLFAHQAGVLAFGVLASYGYGLILNVWFLIAFVEPITWATALATLVASLAFDGAHALSTAVFLALIYRPWVRKLNRVKTKYGILETE